MTQPDVLGPVLRGDSVHLDGTVVYALDGELDLGAAEALRRRLAQLAPTFGGGPVVLDLSGLSFIDCAGLRALRQTHAALRASGGPGLVLRKVQPPVRTVLDLVGVNGYIPVVE